jgi:putative intracellular protease/amidase
VVYDPYSDPHFERSTEPDDLVSKGFLSDTKLVAKLDTTPRLKDVENAESLYSRVGANDPYVVRDGKLLTGQNQQSASEFALVFLHALTGATPVSAN